ncbi:MAG: sensor histidine kinase [Anaerolineales bacterium]|nr:MAG: sensor histidine kinase [Anaerolineales bacterium]
MLASKIVRPFRRLMWKLTLSYTAVTVGSLLIVILFLGYLLFSRIFIPLDIYNSVAGPQEWIRIVRENDSPIWNEILSQEPIDTGLISKVLQESNLNITDIEILQLGDFQLRMRTVGQASVLIVDPNGILLGTSNPKIVTDDEVGQPLDTGILPDLERVLKNALLGRVDPEHVFVTLEPHERFYFAVPLMDETNQEVLGAVIANVERIPTSNDIPANIWILFVRSLLIFLLAAGVVGTIFGAKTSSGMVMRIEQVSQVTNAWSQGDFSTFIDDSQGDEISQLAVHLNHMAEQLQQFFKKSQEMAISEERGRLARDLHDSAKQEALAASFHLGTALTLFERDPENAKKHLLEADSLVDSVRSELTDLIHELRPPTMNGARFDETVNEYLIEWAHQTGIKASLSVNGDGEMPLEVKQAIYRIMQESLANVARHSSAENVEMALSFQDHLIEFSVRDDGVGFDPLEQHAGMGLDSMRERAQALNGEFSIESAMNQGTMVRLTFPVD